MYCVSGCVIIYNDNCLYIKGALLDAVEMHRLCVFIARLYQQCESGVTDERNK